MSSSKHVLNWTSIMVAIPVGCAASLVTLGFRHLIALINQLLFHSDRDITVAITAGPVFLAVAGRRRWSDRRFFCAMPPRWSASKPARLTIST